MKYNFNVPFKGLDGKEVTQILEADKPAEVLNLGKLLANRLMSVSEGNSLKLYDLSKRIFNGEEMNIDRSDRKMLIELIEKDKQISNLLKAQLLEILDNGIDTTE